MKSVAVPGLELPTDRNGQFWVHFNKHDPCALRLGEGRAARPRDADRMRGRLVLVGTSAIGLLDTKTTPVEPAMPGVEVHAQILESALTKSLLTHPNYAIGAELLLAVCPRPRHHHRRADAPAAIAVRARRPADRRH